MGEGHVSRHPMVSFISLLDKFHARPRGIFEVSSLWKEFARNISQTPVMDRNTSVFFPIGFFLRLAHQGGTLGSKRKGYTYKNLLSKLMIS